jgi:prepilin signal peptidase PulO-like enzyme (type II secretory pathway)
VLLSEPARADPRATTAGARPARARTPPAPAAVALLLAVALPAWALSGAAYDPAQWGALSVALAVVVVAVLWGHPRAPSPAAIACLAGLLGLTAWSALSMTWAESVTRAWTESNRWGLYLLVLAITVLCVRSTRLAQTVVVAMAGACALVVVSIVARMVAGDAALFWDFRLNGPLGYINGACGWSWRSPSRAGGRRCGRSPSDSPSWTPTCSCSPSRARCSRRSRCPSCSRC